MTNTTLVDAIVNKKKIKLVYNGQERVVEPHAYGLDKNGQGKIRVFQIAESQEHAGWRLLREEAITDIQVLSETFDAPEAGYSRDDRHIPNIIAQL